MSVRQTFKTEVGAKPVDYEFKLDTKGATVIDPGRPVDYEFKLDAKAKTSITAT